MKKIIITIALIAIVACLCVSSITHADTITLDFETPATGVNIIDSPLSTQYGNITASTSTGGALYLSNDPLSGLPDISFWHIRALGEPPQLQFGQLQFDFIVDRIDFLYSSYIAGTFYAEILDSSLSVLDSFFDNSHVAQGGPITLTGSNIRYFRFKDTGGLSCGVDNVQIHPVPELSTSLLVGFGLTGVVVLGRRKLFGKA